MHRSKTLAYSITSSARSRIAVGSSMPIALAVLRLTTSSNFVACSTGRSVGFARLLCARRERPRRRAGCERDELAPLHVWMAPAWQEITSRAAQKSLAVMCPACSRSPDGLLALMGSASRGLITRTGSMSQ